MSTQSFDSALDFLPEAAAGRRSVWQSLRLVATGISDGLEAEMTYRRLVARGMAPADAVAKVFSQNFPAR